MLGKFDTRLRLRYDGWDGMGVRHGVRYDDAHVSIAISQ